MSVDIQSLVKNLHPLEVRVILAYQGGDELSVERVERDLGFKGGNGNQALSWLGAKGIVRELRRETAVFFELTDLGRGWKEKGAPEERIIELVRMAASQGHKLPQIAQTLGLDNKDAGSAFGALSKLGVLGMDAGKGVVLALSLDQLSNGRPSKGEAAEYFALLRLLLDKAAAAPGGLLARSDLSEAEAARMAGIAKKRGAAGAAFREADRETVVFGFQAGGDEGADRDALAAALKAAGITGDEIGALTPEMLSSGAWKDKNFRSYNVQVPPSRLIVGRTNPYAQFLEKR